MPPVSIEAACKPVLQQFELLSTVKLFSDHTMCLIHLVLACAFDDSHPHDGEPLMAASDLTRSLNQFAHISWQNLLLSNSGL